MSLYVCVSILNMFEFVCVFVNSIMCNYVLVCMYFCLYQYNTHKPCVYGTLYIVVPVQGLPIEGWDREWLQTLWKKQKTLASKVP